MRKQHYTLEETPAYRFPLTKITERMIGRKDRISRNSYGHAGGSPGLRRASYRLCVFLNVGTVNAPRLTHVAFVRNNISYTFSKFYKGTVGNDLRNIAELLTARQVQVILRNAKLINCMIDITENQWESRRNKEYNRHYQIARNHIRTVSESQLFHKALCRKAEYVVNFPGGQSEVVRSVIRRKERKIVESPIVAAVRETKEELGVFAENLHIIKANFDLKYRESDKFISVLKNQSASFIRSGKEYDPGDIISNYPFFAYLDPEMENGNRRIFHNIVYFGVTTPNDDILGDLLLSDDSESSYDQSLKVRSNRKRREIDEVIFYPLSKFLFPETGDFPSESGDDFINIENMLPSSELAILRSDVEKLLTLQAVEGRGDVIRRKGKGYSIYQKDYSLIPTD